MVMGKPKSWSSTDYVVQRVKKVTKLVVSSMGVWLLRYFGYSVAVLHTTQALLQYVQPLQYHT